MYQFPLSSHPSYYVYERMFTDHTLHENLRITIFQFTKHIECFRNFVILTDASIRLLAAHYYMVYNTSGNQGIIFGGSHKGWGRVWNNPRWKGLQGSFPRKLYKLGCLKMRYESIGKLENLVICANKFK